MHNQNDIARTLTRADIYDVHNGIAQMVYYNPMFNGLEWKGVVTHPVVVQYIESAGWVVTDYVDKCREYAADNPISGIANMWVCYVFAEHYE